MIKYNSKSFIRMFVIGILFVVVAFLFYFNAKPSRVYQEDFKGLRSPITGPFDANQLKIADVTSDGVVKMDRDQFYFNVYFSEIFIDAVFRVKFKNENHPQLDLKVPIDKAVEDAIGYPLEQKPIDELKQNLDWSVIQEKSMILLQKRDAIAHYDSIDGFSHNLPVTTKNNKGVVATFGEFNFGKDAKISQTQIIPFDNTTDLKKTDYVIGRYEPWKQDGEWKTNEYKIIIPEAFRKKHVEFPFFIEALRIADGQNDIKIDSIEVTLKRPKVSFVNKVSLFFQRIFSDKENNVKIK